MLLGGNEIHVRLWDADSDVQTKYYVAIILFFIIVEGINMLIIRGTGKIKGEHETAGCFLLFISAANFIFTFIIFGFWAGGM